MGDNREDLNGTFYGLARNKAVGVCLWLVVLVLLFLLVLVFCLCL